jgi:hypothetical protein
VSSQGALLGDRSDTCCPLHGTVDDVRVYARVLTSAEIASLAAQ